MAERAYIVTKGVVLRETETKEADKILTLLTADRGKISVIARGVRRKSCKYAACAQQLVYSEWTLYQKGEWYYANEGATAELFNGLRTNLEALALGCYFAELTETVTAPEVPAGALLPHLLNRGFHADGPNRKWVTDISYIHTKQGVLYLSMIRDLYDNSIVAYKTGTEQTVGLVLDTIRLAMKREKKKVAAELHLHSDQGFQYTSRAYFNLTQAYGITPVSYTHLTLPTIA